MVTAVICMSLRRVLNLFFKSAMSLQFVYVSATFLIARYV